MGNCLTRKGQFAQAADAYARGIDVRPERADLWLYRGLALRQMGKDDEGIQCLMRAQQLDPNVINLLAPQK